MRQRRVAALALPLPAANGHEVSAMRAVDLECHGRHGGRNRLCVRPLPLVLRPLAGIF